MKLTLITPTNHRANELATWLRSKNVPAAQRVMHREQIVCFPDDTNFQHVETVLDVLGLTKQDSHGTKTNKQTKKENI